MRYAFGPFTLDLGRYELVREGEAVDIQPKAFDVLRLQVENAERTVPKDELLDGVWTGVSVAESPLTQAIRLARVELGEADPPRAGPETGLCASGGLIVEDFGAGTHPQKPDHGAFGSARGDAPDTRS